MFIPIWDVFLKSPFPTKIQGSWSENERECCEMFSFRLVGFLCSNRSHRTSAHMETLVRRDELQQKEK